MTVRRISRGSIVPLYFCVDVAKMMEAALYTLQSQKLSASVCLCVATYSKR